jgi:hypothetical protein
VALPVEVYRHYGPVADQPTTGTSTLAAQRHGSGQRLQLWLPVFETSALLRTTVACAVTVSLAVPPDPLNADGK